MVPRYTVYCSCSTPSCRRKRSKRLVTIIKEPNSSDDPDGGLLPKLKEICHREQCTLYIHQSAPVCFIICESKIPTYESDDDSDQHSSLVKAEPSQNEESEISSSSDDDDMIYDNDYYPLVGPPPQWHHSLPPPVPAHDWQFEFNISVLDSENPFFAAADNPQTTSTDSDAGEGLMELEDGVSTALAKSRSIGIIIPITFSSNTGGVIEGCSK
jgi:hypothetical protein